MILFEMLAKNTGSFSQAAGYVCPGELDCRRDLLFERGAQEGHHRPGHVLEGQLCFQISVSGQR